MLKKSRELTLPKGEDSSRHIRDVYTEIEPLAYDTETGEVLNKELHPILKKTGTEDIQEKIDSYKEDADIYNLLKKVAQTGNTQLLNQKQGSYLDLTSIPDNIHDMKKMAESQSELIAKATKQDKSDALSQKTIEQIVDERIKAAMAQTKKESSAEDKTE